MKTIRKSNYELMRIISTVFIILWHVIINTEQLNNVSPKLRLVLDIILVIIVVHINSYVLLTGYFQSECKLKPRKILSIINISWFYRIVITVIIIGFGIKTLTNLQIIRCVFILPIGHEHWFIHYYILLYLISPFLNKIILSINQKEYKTLLIISMFINTILPYLTNQLFYTNNFGFSLEHFINLYLIGGYLKKYQISRLERFREMPINKLRKLIIFFSLTCAFLNLTIIYFGTYIGQLAQPNSILSEISTILRSIYGTYDFFITVLQSIAYFLFFSTFELKNKLINRISSLTLGIYIIHELELLKDVMYDYYWKKVGIAGYGYNILLKIFLFVIIIFITSALIEFLRQLLAKVTKQLYLKVKRVN